MLGSLLLTLPISSRSGEATDFLTALFTATSATCVTGLVVVDTYTHWSIFGQIVIIIMIQLGGLGFMTLVSLAVLAAKKTMGLKSRLIMIKSLNLTNLQGITYITKRVLIGTAIFEGCGAILLSIRFIKDYGFWGGIYKGIFHAVSAFCNGGFDLMGEYSQFSSLISYQSDFVVNVVIMLLIIIGGIGFLVWDDVYNVKKLKHLSVHTKIVLITSAILTFGAAILFYIWEYNNPGTMANLSGGEKVLASLFQSVTARTAGFNTIPQETLTEQSKVLMIIIMIIGGSPGSTAGGIKTVTMAVLIIAAISALKGKSEVSFAGRSIPNDQIMSALALIMVALIVVSVGTFAISVYEDIPFLDVLYETASAFGTVGITLGITSSLGVPSKIILILMMFMGRIGVLTLGYVTLARKKDKANIKYPDANLMIG